MGLWRWLLSIPRRLARKVRRAMQRRRNRRELLLAYGRERAVLEVVDRANEIAAREAREVRLGRARSIEKNGQRR